MLFKKEKGLTLIELLIVIGILAILMAGIIVAVNPARQFSQARDVQRLSNLQAILSAITQNMVDNRGTFNCAAGVIPTSTTTMSSAGGGYNICACLVPLYLPSLPFDPSAGVYADCSNYNTGYQIFQNTTTGRITVAAPAAELGPISATR